MIFYNNDLDDTAIDKILKEKEEEQYQYIQEQYDKGIIPDYSNNIIINGNTKTNSSNHSQKREKQESQQKEVYSQKYVGNNYLAEAVLIGNTPYFAVSTKLNDLNDFPSIILVEAIPLNETTILKPTELMSYLNKPYVFESKEQFYEYVEEVKNHEDLYSLFKKVKSIWKKYVDADDFHISICAADTVFTYMQDKIGLTHYLFFIS